MPVITKITEQKKRANRRSVFLDGAFAFGVNLNVVAKFGLVEGDTLSAADVERIQQGEVRQETFDKAIGFISRRPHSKSELQKKLARYEFGPDVIRSVIAQLEELGYINDAAFSAGKAEAAAKLKHHGKNRAMIELQRKGVPRETAKQAIDQVYESHDSNADARLLATRKMRSLGGLEPHVIKRRLYGMLLRRGFDFATIKPAVEQAMKGEM